MAKPTIKARVKKLQTQFKKLEKEMEKVRSECPHPSYVKGLSIIGCITECYLCEDCGETKPLQYDWFADNPNG